MVTRITAGARGHGRHHRATLGVREVRFPVTARVRWHWGRALAALLAVSAGVVIVVTDVHGRTESRDTATAVTSLRQLEAQEATLLTKARARTWVTTTQDWSQQAALAKARTSLVSTDAANAATTAALAAADYDLAALQACLAGATMALDQLAVGQRAGALSSLSAVSSSCSAAKPDNG